MARKVNNIGALWWMALFVPVAWVCNLCSSDIPPSPPPPAAAPHHEPEPKQLVELSKEAEPPELEKKRPAKKQRLAKTKKAELQDSDLMSAVDAAAKPAPSRTPVRAARTCCKHCGPKSQPCGDSCISRRYTCHKGPGCAC